MLDDEIIEISIPMKPIDEVKKGHYAKILASLKKYSNFIDSKKKEKDRTHAKAYFWTAFPGCSLYAVGVWGVLKITLYHPPTTYREEYALAVGEAWRRSAYYSAMVIDFNRTCQELTSFMPQIDAKNCNTTFSDTNLTFYDNCYPNNSSLALDNSCKEIFGSFNNYATCAWIFHQELSAPFNEVFGIDCDIPSSDDVLSILAIVFGFLIGFALFPCTYMLIRKDELIKTDTLSLLDRHSNFLQEFEGLTRGTPLAVKFGYGESPSIWMNKLKDLKARVDNNKKMGTFFSHFYERDRSTKKLVRRDGGLPKDVLRRIYYFVDMSTVLPDRPDEKSKSHNPNSNMLSNESDVLGLDEPSYSPRNV